MRLTEYQAIERRIKADERNVEYIANCRDMRTIEHVVSDCACRYVTTLEAPFSGLRERAIDNLRAAVRVASMRGVLR